ncbi:MAG TPA: hypothetical protein VF622_08140 [Segetibacter sp.]|jgi:hypothetical protein
MEKSKLIEIFKQKKQRKDKKGRIVAGFFDKTKDDFCNWFNSDAFACGCYYCGTLNEESYKLYQLQRMGIRPDATRGGKRGKRLEIDRRNPFEPYDNLENIVWCCYWCNNAKSNFFTEEEFKPIAINIGMALKKVLKEHEEFIVK